MYVTVPHFCWVNAVAWHEFPIHLPIRWKGTKLWWMRFGWKSALLRSLKPSTFANPHVCTKMSSYSPAKSYSMTTAYLQSMNKSDFIFWNWFHYGSVNGQESWRGRERRKKKEKKKKRRVKSKVTSVYLVIICKTAKLCRDHFCDCMHFSFTLKMYCGWSFENHVLWKWRITFVWMYNC